jgi:hypothetical protein
MARLLLTAALTALALLTPVRAGDAAAAAPTGAVVASAPVAAEADRHEHPVPVARRRMSHTVAQSRSAVPRGHAAAAARAASLTNQGHDSPRVADPPPLCSHTLAGLHVALRC